VDFVNANLNDPEISEDLFGAALLVVSECKRRFDSDGVLRLFEEKLERAVQFSPRRISQLATFRCKMALPE